VERVVWKDYVTKAEARANLTMLIKAWHIRIRPHSSLGFPGEYENDKKYS